MFLHVPDMAYTFSELINRAIESGWQPYEDTFFDRIGDDKDRCIQPMVKYED